MRTAVWAVVFAITAFFPQLGAVAAAIETISVKELPGWSSDRLERWRDAWRQSCRGRPWQTAAPPPLVPWKAARGRRWKAACEARPPGEAAKLRRWLEQRFEVAAIPQEALVTGYFEPVLAGLLRPVPPYTEPIYRLPTELAEGSLDGVSHTKQHWSRAEIAGGALDGRGLEIAWADPVDVFFLHIQGSGLLSLSGRKSLRLAYAGSNGHPYHAIGSDLIAAGAIPRERLSMQSIKAWLRAHPREATELMQQNPRYIFFAVSTGEGPRGASGAALTAERSLAVDPAHLPYGLPVWLDVKPHPDGNGQELQRLTVTQDTGKAIRGPARADFFWGTGAAAGELAGRMNASGRIYLLLPRATVTR